MLLLLLHGAAGGWDELLIAVAAFGVLWIAVKLAGRKPANEADDASDESVAAEEEEDRPSAAKPPAAKMS